MIRRALALTAFVLCLLAASRALAQQSPFSNPSVGYIDPTAATFNSSLPMQHCTGSCSAALVNQNTDALQAALDLAQSTKKRIRIPPGEYPIARGGVSHNQTYGVQIVNYSQIVVEAYGATIRGTGDLGGGDYIMVRLSGTTTNRIRFIGLTWSQRDLTHSPIPEQTHMLQLGVGNDQIDDVQVVDCAFIEGKGGDAIRFLGGSALDKLVTRFTVRHSLIDGKRSGLSFQHGSSMLNAVRNTFGPNGSDQYVDHEPTSPGGNNYENVVSNYFRRPTGLGIGTVLLTTGGYGEGDYKRLYGAISNVWAHNIIDNGVIEGLNTHQWWFYNNRIQSQIQGGASVLHCFRVCDDTWVTENWMKQDSTSTGNAQLILFANNGNFGPNYAQVRDNKLEEWQAALVGAVSLQPTRAFVVTGNLMTYHNAANNSGANGFVGVVATSEGTLYGDARPAYSSGIISENVVRRDFLADGTTQAGRMAVGIDFGTGSTTKIGHGVIRDNYVDGALETFFIGQSGASPFIENSYPLITGNTGRNMTSGDNLPGKFRVASDDAERLTGAGAFSSSRRLSILSGPCSSDAYSLADGPSDGFIKHIEVHTACVSGGTLTPSALGDGTTITWLTGTLTPNVQIDLVWDATGAKWWVLGYSNATVVP